MTGGGGYALYSVVPRVWTHLLAIVSGQPLDPLTATPPTWRDAVSRVSGSPAEISMTDGGTADFPPWQPGMSPESPVDVAIQATRDAVFPLYGLDPNG